MVGLFIIFSDEKFLCVPPGIRHIWEFEMYYVTRTPSYQHRFTTRIATITPQLIIKIPRSEWIVPQSNIPTNTFRLNSFTKFYLSVPGTKTQKLLGIIKNFWGHKRRIQTRWWVFYGVLLTSQQLHFNFTVSDGGWDLITSSTIALFGCIMGLKMFMRTF